MKKIKDERGAITLVVLVTVLFIISFLISVYILTANKAQTEKETSEQIIQTYNNLELGNELYYSNYASVTIDYIPIKTAEQLLKIGSGEEIIIDNQIYQFSLNKNYKLMNDIEFDVDDYSQILGENIDWVPIGDTNYNFDGNNFSITVIESDDIQRNYNLSNSYSQYTSVAYIESRGTQYINTLTRITNKTKIEASFKTATLTGNGEMVFGVSESNKNCTTFIANTLTYQNFGKFRVERSSSYWQSNTDYIVIQENGKQTVNGIATEMSLNDDFVGTKPIFIFARNSNAIAQYLTKMKLFSFKIYEDGVLIRNFIPVIRNKDNKPGLFDTINKEFFTNQGTGEFSYRATTNENYTNLSYIESTGTQYINTLTRITNKTKIEASFKTATLTGNGEMVFGVSESNKNCTTFIANTLTYQNFGKFRVERSSSYWQSNTDYIVIQENGKQTVNGIATEMSLNDDFVGTKPIFIFARNSNAIAQYLIKMKLYYFKIYENEVLVKNFIPVLRNEDDTPGLLETVNNVFYSNQGTTEFGYILEQ